jgi:hypothetical protein
MLADRKLSKVQIKVVPAYDSTGKRSKAEAMLEPDGKGIKFLVSDEDFPEDFELEVCYLMMEIKKHHPGKF